ncbi:MAG TPA: hypothetical protein VMS14_06005, partial [Ilumatobacteraceae bacterium]|nr:hypothetical protein [Ilumatobacteraceae bacterium]
MRRPVKAFEPVHLRHTDAVLGGDRAPQLDRRRQHGISHFWLGVTGAEHVHVQVALGEMTE